VLVVAGVLTGELGELDLSQVSARSLGGLVYLILFGSLLAFSAYVWVLRNARTSLVATYAYVNPIVAVTLGWAVLGETIGMRVLVAGGVILAAVALIVSAAPAPASEARSRSTAGARRRTVDRWRAAWATRGR
jgi:drug/metabolite transporter (DMT)-like permease